MTKAIIFEKFGGPEVLQVVDVPEPHAGPGQIRLRVTAAGLNPVDWKLASLPEAAERFGVTLPSGFGADVAGVVDEVGDGVTEFAPGDRVYGGARHRAVAEFAVLTPGTDSVQHTPDGLPDDAVLIGAAAGGVGVLATSSRSRPEHG